MEKLTQKTFQPAEKAIDWPHITSAESTIATAIWYNNLTTHSRPYIANTTVANKPYQPLWTTKQTGPNLLKPSVPSGWTVTEIQTTLQDILHQDPSTGAIPLLHSIITKLACHACKTESPYSGISTFATIHPPSSTFVVNDN